MQLTCSSSKQEEACYDIKTISLDAPSPQANEDRANFISQLPVDARYFINAYAGVYDGEGLHASMRMPELMMAYDGEGLHASMRMPRLVMAYDGEGLHASMRMPGLLVVGPLCLPRLC